MQIVEEGLDDGERRGHDVRPVGRKAADALALFDVEDAHHLVDGTEIVRREGVVVHDAQRILPDETVDLVEVAEGAAHADHLRVGLHFREPVDLLELLGEEFLYFRRLFFGGDAVVREEVGERHGAEAERRIVQNGAAVVVDDLGAAPADLENDALGHVHRVDDAAVNERRLLLFGEHAHPHAAGRLDLVEEGALIFGMADCRRRHGDDAVYMGRLGKALEHFKRFDGLRHALRLQKAVAVHILAEADALFDLVLHHEIAVLEEVDDDEPRGIGAQIDDTQFFHLVPSLFVKS